MEQVEFLNKRAIETMETDQTELGEFNGQVRILEGGGSDEEDYIAPTAPKKSNCIVCGEVEGKYKCPGCHKLYCKPACFTKHQKEKLCIRDQLPQSYKKMKEFTERDLLRDFGFLSSMLEGYDKTRKKLSQIEISLMKHQEMVRYKILAENARNRGIRIQFAPRFIERHRENISFYFTKDKVIYWVFEVVLIMFDKQEDGELGRKPTFKTKRVYTSPICEDQPFTEAIQEFSFKDNDVLVHFGEDLSTAEKLEEKDIKLFIKNSYDWSKCAEDSEMDTDLKDQVQTGNRFAEMSSTILIKKAIRNMTLQEFPTIYLVKGSDEINFGLYYN